MPKDHKHPPHWDVSNIYPSLDSTEYQADFELMNKTIEAFFTYLDTHQIEKPEAGIKETNPQKLAQILDHIIRSLNDIYLLAGTIRAYIQSFVATDSYNAEAKRAMSIFQQSGVRLQYAGTRVDGWIGSLGNLLDEAIELGETTNDHAFMLREIAEQSKYMMSQEEEELAAELSLSGVTAWHKLQGTVTSQLSVDFEVDGVIKKIPAPALISLCNHPDEATRRRAYEAEMTVWKSVEEPLAAALNWDFGRM